MENFYSVGSYPLGLHLFRLLQDIDNQYVKVSYGPRWATYVIGIGRLILLFFSHSGALYVSLPTIFNFLTCRDDDYTDVTGLQLLEQVPL